MINGSCGLGWIFDRAKCDGDGVTRQILGTDHEGNTQTIRVIEERPLTIYLNSQEIVTAMTIGDYPEYLAVGFLRNQGMLNPARRSQASAMMMNLKQLWCAPKRKRIMKKN